MRGKMFLRDARAQLCRQTFGGSELRSWGSSAEVSAAKMRMRADRRRRGGDIEGGERGV